MGKEEINSLSNNSGLGARNKRGHFGQMENNNLKRIMFQKGHRKTIEKIQRYIFPGTIGH